MSLALTRLHVVDAPLPVTNNANRCGALIAISLMWILFFVIA